MADNDKQVFDRAEAELRALGSRLQVTTQELITLYLLMIAKDLAVPLPAAFDGLTTNYATFLNPSGGDINDEKLAMFTYLARVNTDMPTLQYVLCNKIAQARAIASVQPVIPVPIPAAPYIPPAPKKPNPPPVGGLLVVLSSSAATTTTGTAVTLTATVLVPPGRAVSKVEFYEGVTLLGEDTSSPYTFSYTPATIGSKSLTARAYDNSPSPVVSVSNTVTVTVTAPAVPVPVVAIANSVLPAGLINEAQSLAATATITGDTIASVQFRVNGTNQGAADTASPFGISWTPTLKGSYSITAVALGLLGGAATSAAVTVAIFDTKATGGGASAAGASLAAVAQDFILFDNNQAAGGNAASMNISIGGTQVAVFNYGDTAYNTRPFAYWSAANNRFYIGTVASAGVNFQ